MNISPPFCISARLLPALRIGDAWLSADGCTFYLDTPEGEYRIEGLRDPACGGAGVVSRFDAMLGFLSAAAESYRYRVFFRKLSEPLEDSNETLFEPAVTEWAYQNDSEIQCAQSEIQDESGNRREELIEE